MNIIKNVGDLVKALSAYPDHLLINFSVDNIEIGRGIITDQSLNQSILGNRLNIDVLSGIKLPDNKQLNISKWVK